MGRVVGAAATGSHYAGSFVADRDAGAASVGGGFCVGARPALCGDYAGGAGNLVGEHFRGWKYGDTWPWNNNFATALFISDDHIDFRGSNRGGPAGFAGRFRRRGTDRALADAGFWFSDLLRDWREHHFSDCHLEWRGGGLRARSPDQPACRHVS